MVRRSHRLLDTGYYTDDGTPSISYREILYRIFRSRARRRGYHNANTTEIWTPNTGAHVTSITEIQTRRNTMCSFSVKNIVCFLLSLLLAFEITHIHFQLEEALREVQSLRQQMDKFVTLADTIPNFALESQGARVLHDLSTDTYWPHKHIGQVWHRILYWDFSTKRQRQVIQGHSSLRPGQCWCFSGDNGHLLISLSHPISVTHVTLGHITKSQSPHGYIASAPREFSIYGMRTVDEEGSYLGRLAYDIDGAAFQTFKLPNPDNGVFRYVKLQIENNWGNTDNTCLYSFRVHGNLSA
ncbi:SUN domain-containing protein 3-like [Trachinotus anak]|uniref:SUN domain-containing protein 3-like n=1 Tax=Trachinotus anak TaxID=443729 RepID=UPI0039F1AEBE